MRRSTLGLVCFESVSSLGPYITSPPRATCYGSFHGSSQLPLSSLSQGWGGYLCAYSHAVCGVGVGAHSPETSGGWWALEPSGTVVRGGGGLSLWALG